jgi:Lrp/AsnC family leucine-responsive transcriptional regulator
MKAQSPLHLIVERNRIVMLDSTDIAILRCLEGNARLSWKEIGESVHMTGQAVAARVARLEETGVIERYTLQTNKAKLGTPVTAHITVFMKTSDHRALRTFVAHESAIAEAHRSSGEGCYWLRAIVADHDELNRLLEQLLQYGNYRVSLSLESIK